MSDINEVYEAFPDQMRQVIAENYNRLTPEQQHELRDNTDHKTRNRWFPAPKDAS